MPEPASAVAPPLGGATANGTAVPVIAPTVPAAEHIASPGGDGESIEITPEEKAALIALISQAAMADGFKGKGYVRAWVQKHYKIDVSDVAEIPREIRAGVRAHALRVIERKEQGAPGKAAAPTNPP